MPYIFQRDTRAIKLFVITTILLLFTSCAHPERALPVISSIDLKTEKSIPVGEAIIFGRINVVINDKPFVWDEPSWNGFHLYLISDSNSEPVVYTLFHDGTFSWHLPPGHYSITSFRWSRGRNYLIRPVFARFSVSEQLKPSYIGELAINFIQTGPPGYPQKAWRLPRDFPEMHVVDNYQQAFHQQQFNIPGAKGEAIKSLMWLEKKE